MKEKIDTTVLTERILDMCQKQKISVNKMLQNSNSDKSAVDNLKKGSAPSVYAVMKIAEYFDVSVDYLLGRTNNPHETSISVTDNKQTSITGNNSISVNAADNKKDTLTEQFMQKFEQLDFDDKVDVMQYVKNKK